jgi:uncharacterized protein YndB with AHSA1/START domain
MNKNKLIAKVSTVIDAPMSVVWDALTNPEQVKKYFFGTDMKADWKVGGTIEFTGEWEGKSYHDKGKIVELIPGKKLTYTYLSSMSGQEDVPENYANVTYELAEENGGTRVTIIQDNVATEEGKQHSEQNWQHILKSLSDLVVKA